MFVKKVNIYSTKKFLFCLVGLSIPFSGFSILNVRSFELGLPFCYFFALLIVLLFIIDLACGTQKIIKHPVLIGLLLLTISATFSITTIWSSSFDLKEWLKSFIHLMFLMISTVAMSNIKINDTSLIRILKIFLILAGLISMYGIYQAFARNLNLPLAWLEFTNIFAVPMRTTPFFGYIRPSSVLGEPFFFAHYLIPYIILLWTAILSKKKIFFKNRLIEYVLLFLLIAGFIMAFSLSTIFILFLIFSIMLLFFRVRYKIKFLFTLSIIFLIIFLFNIYFSFQFNINLINNIEKRIEGIFSQIVEKAEPIRGESLSSRLQHITIAFKIWQRYPIFGAGIGNFGFHAINEFQSSNPYCTGGHLINILSEQGLIGLLSFAFLLYFLFKSINIANFFLKKTNSKLYVLSIAYFYILISQAFFITGILKIEFWFTVVIINMLYSNAFFSRTKEVTSIKII